MPTLKLQTNVPGDTVSTSDFLKEASKAVAKVIGKPESYVLVTIQTGVPTTFAGTEEPAAYGEVISIGGLNPDVNRKLSAAIAELLQRLFNIPANRYYIKFTDVAASTRDPRNVPSCLHALHQGAAG